jgi:hypothetical protein
MVGMTRNTVASSLLACLLLCVAASWGTGQHPAETPGSSPSVFPAGQSGRPIAPPLGTSGPAALVGAAGEMIGFTHTDGSGTQTITLVHTGKSWMAVYHIDRSGTLRLVSSRAIDADFSLQLNATSPLPEEIRKMGKSR